MIFLPALLLACGPFFEHAVFSFESRADDPERFAAGELGIVGEFDTPYLLAAFHVLARPGQACPLPRAPVREDSHRFEEWNAARAAQVEPLMPIGPYSSALNCADDAFRVALETLADRQQRWGADSPLVRDWLRAQDRVFQACSGAAALPEPAPRDAPALLRKDRDYQLAAAHFYLGDNQVALARFRRIGADKTSPWRPLARYLTARVLVRDAEALDNAPAWERAERAALRLAKDPVLGDLRTAARALANRAGFHAHPLERLAAFERALSGGACLSAEDAWDAVVLVRDQARPDSPSALAAWVSAMQDRTPQAKKRAAGEAARSRMWLMAALVQADAEDPGLDELLSRAAAVPRRSPAWATLTFHRARLELARGRRDGGLALLDELLADPSLSRSSRNRVHTLRLTVAQTWDEVLAEAVQRPAHIVMEDESVQTQPPRPRLFTPEGARVINSRFDGEALRKGARRSALPVSLRLELLGAAFTRAALLEQDERARSLAAEMIGLDAALQPRMTDIVDARGRSELRFALALALGRLPGLSPLVRADMPRPEPLWRADNYRHNWWRAADVPADSPRPELRAVTTVGPPADWMLRRILEYARLHPRDPRLPEALFRAVRAGRLGESGPQTQKLQRAGRAFADRHFPGDPLTARIVW